MTHNERLLTNQNGVTNDNLTPAYQDLIAELRFAEDILVTAFGEPSGNSLEHGRAASAIVRIRAVLAKCEESRLFSSSQDK